MNEPLNPRPALPAHGPDLNQETAHLPRPAAAEAPALPSGSRLGAWTLLRPIGEGGMGMVYLAERSDGHYEQRTAIKLLRGVNSAVAMAQLTRERQILASLKHPNIARLIDGGTAPDGQPYLVMDYVAGERIDAYVHARAPSLHTCLSLFQQICEAVAHAHRQLIVHCDLKPGNVLVDAEGRAMLLDFGIAQLPGLEDTRSTAMTPRFASPEQQVGQAASTLSDIYSLGCLLAELLKLLPAHQRLPAARRAELAAIVRRACRAEPQQRYLDVTELQDDLRAFEQHRPLRACEASRAYRLRKLLRRRWPWFAAGLLVLGLTAAFTLSLVRERDRAEAARLQALDQADKAEQVRNVVIGIFEDFDPFVIGREPKSFSEFIDDARRRVDADLSRQPQVQAELKHVLGLVYQRSGRSTEAIALLEQALALQRTLPQRDLVAEATSLHEIAVAMVNTGMAARALPLAREALRLREAAQPVDGSHLGDSLAALGLVLSKLSRFDEAGPLYERALQVREANDGAQSGKVASALHSLGSLAEREERYVQAQQFFERSLALKAKLMPDTHPYVLNTRHGLALSLLGQQRVDEAVKLLREVLAQRSAVQGEASVFAAETRSALSRALLRQGPAQQGEAQALARRNLAQFSQAPGRRSALYASELALLAQALSQGQPKASAGWRQARALLQEALEIQQSLPEQDAVAIALLQLQLGQLLLQDGALSEAGPALQAAALALSHRHWSATHSLALRPVLALAQWQLAGHQAAPALATLQPLLSLPALPAEHEAALRALLAALRQSGQPVPERGQPS